MMGLIPLVVVVVVGVVFGGDHACMVYNNTIMHSDLSCFFCFFFQDFSSISDIIYFVLCWLLFS